jgi:hypothetical protein
MQHRATHPAKSEMTGCFPQPLCFLGEPCNPPASPAKLQATKCNTNPKKRTDVAPHPLTKSCSDNAPRCPRPG